MATDNRREITWRTDILLERVRTTLNYLAEQQWLKQSRFYLAGGTALALQVGHRISLDLDFFTPQKDFSSIGDLSLTALINKLPSEHWVTNILREKTLYGSLFKTKVSFITYPFFVPRQPYRWFGAVRILDPRDIAVMKIIAISQRGSKRDFIDLYWYCQNQESLIEVLRRLPDQYPKIAHNYSHILKSLTYFTDAEADPMPRLFFNAAWKEIKRFFETEVPKITHELIL